MNQRIEEELALLRLYYKTVELSENGDWIMIRDYRLPEDTHWNINKTDICFHVKPDYPGNPPYGFYVKAGIMWNGENPSSYKEPPDNQPPFQGPWGFFSWTKKGPWSPKADVKKGSNLLDFVRSFKERFLGGK